MICDLSGVPLLVQNIIYRYGDMTFEVLFFNGRTVRFLEEDISGNIGLCQKEPTRMQMLEVENNIGKASLTEWAKWFPND